MTISLNTHRTHPDNLQDAILLKNLCKEAGQRLEAEFGKKAVQPILDRLAALPEQVDINTLLDSLHLFISHDTFDLFRSSWPTHVGVHISGSFDMRHLIKAYNRSEEYMIMLVSQSGVHLYDALNDSIEAEIKNEDFPFAETTHFHTDSQKLSEPMKMDNMVREYLNKVDKALVKVHHQTNLGCVVVCTRDNYDRLMQVADKPQVYRGHVPVNYNDTATHTLAAEAWKLVKSQQEQGRKAALEEVQSAVGQGRVLTDIREIYRAAREGRGDLLVTQLDYVQPVRMNGESFDLIDAATMAGDDDDITGDIAWEVVSKKGRAVFIENEDMGTLAPMALKVRY